MRIGKNTLNNMMLSNLRKNQVYQAIITDLAITGSIERDTAEKLLGYEIPGFLKTPDGKHLEENKQQPVKKDDEDVAEDNNDDDNEDNSDENNDDEEDDRDVAEDDDEE